MKLAENGLSLLATAIEKKGKEVVEEKLGVKISDDPDPEELAQLANLQMQREEMLLNLTKAEMEHELEDRKSARQRDVDLAKATGQRNLRADLMVAGAGVFSLVIFLAVIWSSSMDEFQKSVLSLIIGRVLGYIDQAFNFEFGTTRQSRSKDETINKLSRNGK